MKIGHAPRERVSWNFAKLHILFHKKVTLHVSVWVEITHFSNNYIVTRSRSTWACELKFMNNYFKTYFDGHAPRERVSWNDDAKTLHETGSGHAPRERVSWNSRKWVCDLLGRASRSTWACELKFRSESKMSDWGESRSTWAWELKSDLRYHIRTADMSRSTWACELKCTFILTYLYYCGVTLHVSVWVEIK